jgi:DNA-binding PadR family transcriptional regulator
MGAMHGYSIARRIEMVCESHTRLSQGSVYPALIRLEQHALSHQVGPLGNRRKVKVYELTKTGSGSSVSKWPTGEATALVARFLATKS